MTWEHRAACLGADPALFDPVTKAEGDAGPRISAAKAYCANCPVTADCLTAARAHRDSGVRGGLLLNKGKPVRTITHMAKPPCAVDDCDKERETWQRPLCAAHRKRLQRHGTLELPPPTPRAHKACGTTAAYDRHRRLGEEIDDACRAAWNHYMTELRRAQGEQPRKVIPHDLVRQRHLLGWTHANIALDLGISTSSVFRSLRDNIDQAAVARIVAGLNVRATHMERREAVRRMTAAGMTAAEIARRIGTSRRTVERMRRAA